MNVQGLWKSVLGENSKELTSSAISAEASFDNNSNKDALNVNNVLSAAIEKNKI